MTEKKGVFIIQNRLKTVSQRAGVYRMLNSKNEVIYVGKAKNLKKRLANYTHLDRLSTRIRQMVSEVASLITIETASEAEALILENNLIKEFHPFYNILLKDDKSYPYILITNDRTPRLMKYRGQRTIKGNYFGPFPSGLAVNQTIKELQRIFGLRTCNNTYFSNRTRPCLLYQIGRCSAPCTYQISDNDYQDNVKQTLSFLKGEPIALQAELTHQMQTLSKNEQYEQAAQVRNKLMALNQIQNTESETTLFNTDIVACFRQGSTACIQVFFYRSGHAGGNTVHFLEHLEDISTEDILTTFLLQFYDRIPPPKEILISESASPAIADILSQRSGFTVTVSSSVRSNRLKLLRQAKQNAEQSFYQHIQEENIQDSTWEELRQLLQVPHLDKIEIYDNSHIQGSFAVGAMVVATKDGFKKNLYRRFNIDGTHTKTNDDFGMMKEVLLRRLSRGITEHNLPSALLIDGGKGQLSSVMEILHDIKITDIAVLAIAKGEKRGAGLEVFYLGSNPTTPIHLDLKSDLIHLLQRLRDEAHRYAIGSHRMKRAQNMFHETLLDIEDIGQKRKKALLLHFGSVREIAGASLEQLSRVPGISEKIAKKVYTFYHG